MTCGVIVKKFTLIELLVVVAIIGILASLLLPSLRNARLAAMVAVCTSNQKQIGIAIVSYTGTNDEIWPFSPQVSAEEVGATIPDNSKVPAEVIWFDAGESIELFVCPTDPEPEVFTWWAYGTNDRQYFLNENARHSYMFNEWATWLRARFQDKVFRVGEMEDPAKWPQMTDGEHAVSSQNWNRCDPSRVGNYGVMDWWHPREKVNILLGDGHIENKSAYVISAYDPH